MPILTLLTATAVATGTAVECLTVTPRQVEVTMSGAGTTSLTALVEVANDSAGPWLTLATVTLAGAAGAGAADGFSTPSSWPYTRARITAASVTAATVTMAV